MSGRAVALGGAFALAALLGVVLAWTQWRPAPGAHDLVLRPAAFADLPGWGRDHAGEAMAAFFASCGKIAARPPATPLGIAGTAADWREPCEVAAALAPGDDASARTFFEQRFRPWEAADGGRAVGLFTGYYEPELEGSLVPDPAFPVPLYRRPPDLVEVDLGAFRPALKGQRLAGRVVGGRLRPYDDRAAIAGGSLKDQGLELAWVADPVAAFFLEIQGSGQVLLPDGGRLRLGFDGQNGWPYAALGKVMVERGLLEKGKVTAPAIKDWLAAHPDQAQELMNANPSYVFFRDLGDGPGPLGAQGVALTPGRSLAVDRKFYPLGLPVWLSTELPGAEGGASVPFQRLMVGQDTGGAITGPVRGDVFFGAGGQAEVLAGAMQSQGRMWILLPAGVTPPSSP